MTTASRKTRGSLGLAVVLALIGSSLLVGSANAAVSTPAGVVTAPVSSGPLALAAPTDAPTYSNPLTLDLGAGLKAEQCADPDIIRSQDPGDPAWYLFCTRDALNSALTEPDGSLTFSSIPTYRSTDLVTWTFVAEALPTKPAWIADGDMWAPDVAFIDGRYLLYYTATATVQPGGGSAIGVATSDSPAGPWVDSGGPVVEPMPPVGGDPGERRWVFDPEVITFDGTNYIYFGSYYGGLSVRTLSADGLTSDAASQVQIAISNRYEASHVIQRDGWFYLLGSATNCCSGPTTGYAVFAGRAQSPFGPFVDRAGVSLLDGRVGGTPVLHQNGNRWIGTGHHTVVNDFDGQQWIVYHAVDRNNPYMASATGYTRRPVLMDPLDWQDGWPVVRGGHGPSDSPVPGPAAQPGQTTGYTADPAVAPVPGTVLGDLSDDFAGTTLSPQWSWFRTPGAGTFAVDNALRWATQASDLNSDPADPTAVLVEAAPDGDYVVETELSMTLPANGCCQNYVQAGLVVMQDGGNFVKLVTVSIWETRQTEFARRTSPVPAGFPEYGNTVGGPVGDRTLLRIVRTHSDTEALFTGFTSIDGTEWDEAGTWTMPLGGSPKIGLVSMGGAGFEATFHRVTVSEVAPLDAPSPVPSPSSTSVATTEPSAVDPATKVAESVAPGVGGSSSLAATGSAAANSLIWLAACLAGGLGAVALRRRATRK